MFSKNQTNLPKSEVIEGTLLVSVIDDEIVYDLVFEKDFAGNKIELTHEQKLRFGLIKSKELMKKGDWDSMRAYFGLSLYCLQKVTLKEDYDNFELVIQRYLLEIDCKDFSKKERIKLSHFFDDITCLTQNINLPHIARVAKVCGDAVVIFLRQEEDLKEKRRLSENLRTLREQKEQVEREEKIRAEEKIRERNIQLTIENNRNAEINKNIQELERKRKVEEQKIKKAERKERLLLEDVNFVLENLICGVELNESKLIQQEAAIDIKKTMPDLVTPESPVRNIKTPMDQFITRSIFYSASQFPAVKTETILRSENTSNEMNFSI